MRIWSLHPKYLDARGLVALWREGLLAQAVLRGQTIGYRNHPQLARFLEQASPVCCIAAYLHGVHAEASQRGYMFALERVCRPVAPGALRVSRGQLDYEWAHLLAKLRERDPKLYKQLCAVQRPQAHPLFRVVRGGVAPWERI